MRHIFRRESSPPQFDWVPEKRPRLRRYGGLFALALAVTGLGYGAAQVAAYFRTTSDRAIAVTAPAGLSFEPRASNGSDAVGAIVARESEPQATNPAPAVAKAESAPAPAPAGDAKAGGVAESPSSTVALLKAETPPEDDAEADTSAQAKVTGEKPPGAKASRPLLRDRPASARLRKQRQERRMAVRERRAPDLLETTLPWRFAPTLRADARVLRREDGRRPLPFGPRYYGELPY
jgi:hypothetical protein